MEYMCIGGQHLGMKISKEEILDEAISYRNVQRRAISMLYGILRDKTITKENK